MRIAIVTGASSGIGKEFFVSLNNKREEIDEIWVVARNLERLEALSELTDIKVRPFALDLSDTSSVRVIQKTLEEEKPVIKYMICASGFGRFEAIEDSELSVLENMVDLNCKSIVSITKIAMDYLDEGSLVMLIASMAAFQPIPYIAVYGATKSFVLSYGRAYNKEISKKGARCLCVCPFWTNTAFFDRALSEKQVVKKYAVMYQPADIVKQAWKDVKNKTKDVSIFGLYAKGQAALVKMLPHKFVMSTLLNQQKLK